MVYQSDEAFKNPWSYHRTHLGFYALRLLFTVSRARDMQNINHVAHFACPLHLRLFQPCPLRLILFVHLGFFLLLSLARHCHGCFHLCRYDRECHCRGWCQGHCCCLRSEPVWRADLSAHHCHICGACLCCRRYCCQARHRAMMWARGGAAMSVLAGRVQHQQMLL